MAYGEGSVFRNDRGTWTGFKTIDGKRYKRTAPTKTAVRAAFAQLERDLATGVRGRSESNATVADVLDDWLARDLASRDRAPSTESRHRWAADKVVTKIGTKRAARLTVDDVETMLDQLAADGLGRSSLVKIRNTLSQALRAAIRRKKITGDVAADAIIPADAARGRPRRSLSPTDARALLAALRGERNGLAFALSLRLGLRPGEAWALYWDDIADGAVNVTRSLRREGSRLTIVDDLKTASSKRTIALPDDLAGWLDEHHHAQNLERMAAEEWSDSRLVFASAAGTPVSSSNARRQLVGYTDRHGKHHSGICERAGVPVISPNELRHSCASLLADEGVPNELIADLLGHTTTRMVDQTYRHRLRPVVDVAERSTWASAEPDG